MLSAAVVAASLGTASAFSTGGDAVLPELLGWIAALLVVVNSVGAIWFYRPIRQFLSGREEAGPALERRMRMLPAVSGFWIFGLTAGAMIGDAAGGRGAFGALASESLGMVAETLVHCIVFAAYLGLYAYLLVVDHLISLRKILTKQGRALTLPRRKFIFRVAAALAALAVGPVLIALSDEWGHSAAHDDDRLSAGAQQAAQFLHQTLHMDVLGALLLSGAVAVLLARALSRPLDILLDAMRRVDAGDSATRAPVVTDDEFGMFTERFNRMLDGLNERERLRRMFAHFVPETVAATLLAQKGAIEPQEREATVLFTDIERFTEIASRLAPREVLAMLNDYFEKIARIIHAHGGVITQFQGDAVLASFNLPSSDPDHARHAVHAALETQRCVESVRFQGGIQLCTRTGIGTGVVVGGTVGGGERLGYTVHGDIVNLAARLEALNKELGTRILLSARTAELVGGAIPLRDLGRVTVRGFAAPVRLFEPVVESAVPEAG